MKQLIVALLILFTLNAQGKTPQLLLGPPSPEDLISERGILHPSQEQVEACADCHPEHVEGFKKTHMSRAFNRPLLSEVIEDFSPEKSVVIHPKTQVGYRAFIDDEGQWWQEEFDPKGNYKRQVKVKYLVGSGNHTRSYIGERHGELFELPLTWYSPTKNRSGLWDMSPGYHRPDHFRFSRPIKADCLFCHNDLSPIDDEKLSGFVGDLPSGITCARCHGDGTAHINSRLEGKEPAVGQSDPSILNPSYLSTTRQHQICEQCHLAGEARALLPNKRWDQYDPRIPLEEYFRLYTFKLDSNAHPHLSAAESFGIASHSERMSLSLCRDKGEELKCTTCHNPHRPDDPESYQNACLGCHQGQEQHGHSTQIGKAKSCLSPDHQSESCHSCHMMKSGTNDIPHVRMTDHWIRVSNHSDRDDQNNDSEKHELVYSDHLSPLLPPQRGTDPKVESGLLGLAYAELVKFRDRDEFTARSLNLLVDAAKSKPKWPEVWSALAEMSVKLGDPIAAASAYQKYRELRPYDEYYRLKEVEVLISIKQETQAEELLKEMISRWPSRYQAYEQLANLQMKQLRFQEAEKSYLNAKERAMSEHSISHNLGLLYFVQGDLAKAKLRFEEGISLDGVSSDGPFHLALVEAAEKNYDRSKELMRESLKRNPDQGILYQQLARILFESGDREGSLEPLKEWLLKAPQSLDAYFTLAQYLDALGRYQEVYELFVKANQELSDPQLRQALEISKKRLNQFR